MRRVVATGLGVVSPIGSGISHFFQGLKYGRSGIGAITRFDAQSFTTRIAGEVKEVPKAPDWLDHIDCKAILSDPKSIFCLTAADEAIQDAFGHQSPHAYYPPQRIGMFIGAGLEIFHLQEWLDFIQGTTLDVDAMLQSHMYDSNQSTIQVPSDLAPQAIAKHLHAGAGTCTIVSACAAGTQSIGEAFLAVRDGIIDLAVCGGFDSMINPLGVGGFNLLDALSTSNHLGNRASRPFDAHRDGFVLGEGSGICILEELHAAQKRKARIWAEVYGYASSANAAHVSDPDIQLNSTVRVMQKAMERSCIYPDQIDYINAHGTGTRKNDPVETKAIKSVFKSKAADIPVSSTKSQIGHLIAAAGAVEFIAGVFAIHNGILPATINLTHPDPECDLDYVPNKPRPAKVHNFLSNSFGFGGQNATLVAGMLRNNDTGTTI